MKIIRVLFIILVFIWLSISWYLTYEHFGDSWVVCVDKNSFNFVAANSDWNSCNSVLKSKYSSILWIPTAILWMIFYISILLWFLLTIFKKDIIFKKLLLLWTSIWICFSAFFTYTQLFILDSFCIYCFISAVITLILFIFSIYIFKKK